jgi:hypothetical protein
MDNSFTAWRPEEDATLIGLYENNLTHAQIAQALGRSIDAIDGRRRKLGLKRGVIIRKAPTPDDFEEMALTMNMAQLAKHYGRVRSVIARWVEELELTEIVTSPRGRPKAIPHNFVKMAPTMTRAELMRLYNTDRTTVIGWLKETGVSCMSIVERRAQNAKSVPTKIEDDGSVARREFNGRTKLMAAEAAHFLRRTHPSVHRADIKMYEQSSHTWGDVNNVPHRGINQYFVSGKGMMWLDDLIAYAQAKGFKMKELT